MKMAAKLKSRASWVLCLIGIIAIGILSRTVHTGVVIFDKYLGDALYAAMVYVILRLWWRTAALAIPAMAIMTVIERTKFRDLVRPGDMLVYDATLTSVNEAGGKVNVEARRDGEVVASSGMVFAFKYVDDPTLDERRKALMAVWMRQD